MAGAGAPGGLPLNSRFSPGLVGQDSPISRWRTLILVTPAKGRGHALSFPLDVADAFRFVFGLTASCLSNFGIIP
jgi:hypothetical protein